MLIKKKSNFILDEIDSFKTKLFVVNNRHNIFTSLWHHNVANNYFHVWWIFKKESSKTWKDFSADDGSFPSEAAQTDIVYRIMGA